MSKNYCQLYFVMALQSSELLGNLWLEGQGMRAKAWYNPVLMILFLF